MTAAEECRTEIVRFLGLNRLHGERWIEGRLLFKFMADTLHLTMGQGRGDIAYLLAAGLIERMATQESDHLGRRAYAYRAVP